MRKIKQSYTGAADIVRVNYVKLSLQRSAYNNQQNKNREKKVYHIERYNSFDTTDLRFCNMTHSHHCETKMSCMPSE